MSTRVKITNDYSDGHHSEREVELETPGLPDILKHPGEYDLGIEEWFMDVVYEHTGDGHGNGDYGRLGSCYTAEVIASDHPALIGEDFEWTD